MKINWSALFGVLFVFTVLGGCGDRPREIPDAELIQIVRKIYLSNAYVSTQGKVKSDSLDIYTPIFDRYGYTPQDMRFTIDHLSRRKSVRFSDIIEEATKLIEQELSKYDKHLSLIDTIDARLARRYRKEVYTDSLIHAKRVADTTKLRFNLPLKVGAYRVEFSYRIDTTNKNNYLQYNHYLKDSTKNMSGYIYRSYEHDDKWHRHSIDFDVRGTKKRTLQVDLGYVSTRKFKKYGLHIDSLHVYYFLPKKIGRDSLLREKLFSSPYQYKKPLVADEKPQDFVTLRVDTTGVVAARDSLVRR